MNNHLRRWPLALLGLFAACSSSKLPAGAQRQAGRMQAVATFEGSFDPATRAFTLREVRVLPEGAQGALVELPPFTDGASGTSPRNTLEIRNATPLNDGTGQCADNHDTSWYADVTLQSFYVNQTLTHVYVELAWVSPTGHGGCNNAAPMTGVSAASGLWAYGTLAPGASATATWSFRNVTSEPFTFQGRIMAELNAPVRGTGPEFDWSPSAIVMPESHFVRQLTTTAQLTWNGLGWDSWVAAGGAIAPELVGMSADVVVNLWDPPARYADLSQGYWVADEAHGGNLVDFSGDFTVCAKVKPQANPPPSTPCVFVAKGNDGEGWALHQNDGLYAFRWILNGSAGPSAAGVTSTPEVFDYDYICGGRLGTHVRAQAHGRVGGSDIDYPGTFSSPADLWLAIGGFDDGLSRNAGGVYEVIFDSRGASLDVMTDIVDRAEGRRLFPAAGSYTASYQAAYSSTGTTVIGADGDTYTAPSYGTVPPTNDGTGLAPLGAVVEYTHPLASSTVATGFCLGVEVAATGSWNDAVGGLVSYSGGQLRLQLNANDTPPGPPWVGYTFHNVYFPGYQLPALDDGSRHTILVCQEPYSALQTNHVTMYVDGVDVRQGNVEGASALSLDETGSNIQMGGGTGTATLSGARIGRVFACGSPDPVSCN